MRKQLASDRKTLYYIRDLVDRPLKRFFPAVKDLIDNARLNNWELDLPLPQSGGLSDSSDAASNLSSEPKF